MSGTTTILTLLGSDGRTVEHWTVNRGDGGSISPACTISNHRQFCSPHICLCLARDTKSRWSLLPSFYARGSKKSHNGKCVTCSRLTNSREKDNSCSSGTGLLYSGICIAQSKSAYSATKNLVKITFMAGDAMLRFRRTKKSTKEAGESS